MVWRAGSGLRGLSVVWVAMEMVAQFAVVVSVSVVVMAVYCRVAVCGQRVTRRPCSSYATPARTSRWTCWSATDQRWDADQGQGQGQGQEQSKGAGAGNSENKSQGRGKVRVRTEG